MSLPPAPDEPLQFDEAEYGDEAPAGLACSACAAPIHDQYYETSGQVVCEPCRDRIEGSLLGGSKLGRFLKATVFGTIAAAVGAVLYYIIVRATDYNIGLVAIVVGLMVGGAVRSGSGGRGGWGYQLLALFLTYTAIAGMLSPFLIGEIMVQGEQQAKQEEAEFKAELKRIADEAKQEAAEEEAKAQTEAAAKKDADPQAEPEPAKADPAPVEIAKADAPADAKPEEVAKPDAPADAKPEEVAKADAPDTAPKPEEVAQADAEEGGEEMEIVLAAPPPTPGEMALALAALLALCYAWPVIIAIGHPISGLIYGFALWEAWKINRKTTLAFNGPYYVLPPDANAPEPDDHDEDREHGA